MYVIKYKNQIPNLKLKLGDLVQINGVTSEGDSSPLFGKVQPASFTSSNELVTSLNGLKVEIYPNAQGTVINKEYVDGAVNQGQEELLPKGSKVFPDKIGLNLENGMTVPTGITHLRVGGNVYAMSTLANGLVADLNSNSVTIGEVSVKIAPVAAISAGILDLNLCHIDLSGGNYADSELISYLEFAATSKLGVKARGDCKITGANQIDLGGGISEVDFNGLTFVLDSTNNPFVVSSEYPTVEIPAASLDYAQLTRGAVVCPTLSAYNGMFVTYVSNNASDPDLYRKSATVQPQLRRDCFVVGTDGVLWHPLRTTLKLSDNAIIKATDIKIPELVISGFTLKCEGAVDKINAVSVLRNNVKFVSPRYIDGGTTQPIPVANFISPSFVYGLEVESPVLDPIGDNTPNSYVINYWTSCKIKLSGFSSVSGWAETDGNYSRDIKTENSTVSRVGGHYLCSDMSFINVTGDNNLIETAGGGSLAVRDCKQVISDASSGFCVAVGIRGDYGAEWDGQIVVDGLMVDLRGVDLSSDYTVNIVQALMDSSVGNHNFGRRIQLPTVVNISNVTVFVKPNQAGKVKVRAFVCGQTGSAGISSELMYPKHLTVDNVVISDDNGSTYNFVEVATIFGQLKPQTFYRKMKIDASNVKSADPVRCGLNPSFSGSYTTLSLYTNSRLDVDASLSDCDNARLSTSDMGDSKINVKFKGGSLITIGNPDDSDADTNYELLTSFKGTRFDGAFKCRVMPGSIFKKYLGIDGVTVQQVGFPNKLENNVSFISGVATEVDASIFSDFIDSRVAFNGYALSSRYQSILNYRSAAQNPIGAVTPLHIGEEYLDVSPGQFKWYKAKGGTSADWSLISN